MGSYCTTARIPDGGALILSGVAQPLPGVEGARSEVVLDPLGGDRGVGRGGRRT